MKQYSFLSENNQYIQENIFGDMWSKMRHVAKKTKNTIARGHNDGKLAIELSRTKNPITAVSNIQNNTPTQKRGWIPNFIDNTSATICGIFSRRAKAARLKKERRQRDLGI